MTTWKQYNQKTVQSDRQNWASCDYAAEYVGRDGKYSRLPILPKDKTYINYASQQFKKITNLNKEKENESR